MEVEFQNNALLELYRIGKSRKYPIAAQVIEKFFMRIQQLEAAVDIYDLWKTPSIATYTTRPDGPAGVVKDLASAGVKFLVLTHLQKTYLDGAAFRDGGSPVIVYTARYDRVDNF